MKIGIQAREIMEKDFPILDASLSIESCIRKLNDKYEGCIIIKNGYFYSVLGYEDLLKGFLNRKNHESIENLKIEKHFKTVKPGTDIYNIIELMNHNNIEFVVVRDRHHILGLITKKEITEIEPLIFELTSREKLAM